MVTPPHSPIRHGVRTTDNPARGLGSMLACLGLFVMGTLVPATGMALEALPPAEDARVVPDAILAEQRGGFFGRDGLQIAIGLEQVTALNGEILHQTTLLPLGSLEMAASRADADRHIVILNGAAALATYPNEGRGWVTTIQNQLDGQSIHHQTIMQLELRHLQMPRGDLGRALEQQLLDGGRGW